MDVEKDFHVGTIPKHISGCVITSHKGNWQKLICQCYNCGAGAVWVQNLSLAGEGEGYHSKVHAFIQRHWPCTPQCEGQVDAMRAQVEKERNTKHDYYAHYVFTGGETVYAAHIARTGKHLLSFVPKGVRHATKTGGRNTEAFIEIVEVTKESSNPQTGVEDFEEGSANSVNLTPEHMRALIRALQEELVRQKESPEVSP